MIFYLNQVNQAERSISVLSSAKSATKLVVDSKALLQFIAGELKQKNVVVLSLDEVGKDDFEIPNYYSFEKKNGSGKSNIEEFLFI